MKINGKEFVIKLREELFTFSPEELPVIELRQFFIDGEEVEESVFNNELKKLVTEDDEESSDNN